MKFFRYLYNILLNLGFNPIKIYSYRYIFRFLRQRKLFIKLGGGRVKFYPILDNYTDSAGETKSYYFHQDLLIANYIYKNKPKRHIDVGSRIDGFVAHVASYRTIDVMDIRPLNLNYYDNIKFVQADLMDDNFNLFEICDSLSCLHALEHFGLGRYNDPIDPLGHLKGFNNLTKMLKPSGILYISFPIGSPEVYFNAHRVFAPKDILKWIENKFNLERFDYINDQGDLIRNSSIDKVGPLSFGCGIYTLIKVS